MVCLDQGTCVKLQTAQVRKTGYVLDVGQDYHPDKYHSCTIYAGTMVQQVHTHVSAWGLQWLCASVLDRCSSDV